MKIRIKGNTIRYRLTKSEVEKFCETGSFEEQTNFASAIFKYQIKTKKDISALEADFSNNTITVFFPEKNAEDWAVNNTVGFDATYTTEKGVDLYLLVEKDFVCMDETVEDQSDNYPNPKA